MSILVYLQRKENKIYDGSLELCAKAKELAKKMDVPVYGMYVGMLDDEIEDELEKTKLNVVYTYACTWSFTLDDAVAAVMHNIKSENPEIVLFSGTLEGRSIAPTVAAYCHTGVTADCTELDIDQEGLLVQIRPAFGGDVMAEIITQHARPQIATIRPGVFNVEVLNLEMQMEQKLIIKPIEIEWPIRRMIVQNSPKIDRQQENPSGITIAAGGGVNSKEELDRLAEFCEKKGLNLMCSRELVERGWLSQNKQIGLSGRSISAKLLVTIGVSGSVQFMSGIKQVKRIIAINTDKTAAIMSMADLPICTDLHDLILAL